MLCSSSAWKGRETWEGTKKEQRARGWSAAWFAAQQILHRYILLLEPAGRDLTVLTVDLLCKFPQQEFTILLRRSCRQRGGVLSRFYVELPHPLPQRRVWSCFKPKVQCGERDVVHCSFQQGFFVRARNQIQRVLTKKVIQVWDLNSGCGVGISAQYLNLIGFMQTTLCWSLAGFSSLEANSSDIQNGNDIVVL